MFLLWEYVFLIVNKLTGCIFCQSGRSVGVEVGRAPTKQAFFLSFCFHFMYNHFLFEKKKTVMVCVSGL